MPLFGDGDSPWWDELDENIADDVRRILQESDLDDIVESEDEDIEDEDIEDEADEEFSDIVGVDATEIDDDPHNAPDNQADADWELANHFDFGADAINYVEGVPVGPLWIVWNDDGSADVYVDRDYDGASV